MALDFPATPADGDIYEGYVYDATKGVWRSIPDDAASVISSPIAPAGAKVDNLWFDTTEGALFTRFDDGDTVQWVEVLTSTNGYDDRLTQLESIAAQPVSTARMPSGSVIGFAQKRTDTRITYSHNTSGTIIAELSMPYTPKKANSLIVVQWMINGEWDNNVVLVVYRDGAVVTTSGFQGYNTGAGNVYYSGMVAGAYDQNLDSTPSNHFLQYIAPANSTNATTFQLLARSTFSGGSNNFHLNRTYSSLGGDYHEMTVSTVTLWEIAQ